MPISDYASAFFFDRRNRVTLRSCSVLLRRSRLQIQKHAQSMAGGNSPRPSRTSKPTFVVKHGGATILCASTCGRMPRYNRDRGPSQLLPSHTTVRTGSVYRFAGLSGNSCSIDAVVWMSAIVAPASTPLISASQGFTPSRRSEAGCPEFSRMADAVSLHLLVTSSVQAFSETRSAYYALC